MKKVSVAQWDALEERQPAYALVANVDLVVVRYDDKVSVLYGRCLHRGALMADGTIEGDDLGCGVHGWAYRLDTGVSAYNKLGRQFPTNLTARFILAAEVKPTFEATAGAEQPPTVEF